MLTALKSDKTFSNVERRMFV